MSETLQASAVKRINLLLDDNSFVEIGGLVTARNTDFNLTKKDTPADGVITGYGVINGNIVYVYSQNAAVLGGSVGEMHAKKIVKLYEMALKTGAPVIGLIDCAGMRLEEATDALNAFGEIYLKQVMASGVIPQITAVFGNCGGGMALVPAVTDFTFMEEKNAKLFVNSPNALNGNYTDKNDTASAKFQAENAGLVDFTGDEETILDQIRQLVSILPANNEDDYSFDECTDDLNRACSNIKNAVNDPSVAATEISDNSFFFEIKPDYAKEMVAGFIKLNGATVGLVGNRCEVYDTDGKTSDKFDTVLTPAGCTKAADFINYCDAFSIPVLSLTNVTGFEATLCSEKEIAKAAAKLMTAFADATVPKVNVITGKAYGSAYVVMNSKAIGADVVYAWPDSNIGMMDASLAAKIICNGDADSIDKTSTEYEKIQNSCLSAANRGYVDSIVEPEDTRKYVIGAFEMLFTKREDRLAKKHLTI